ncbi:GMC oxidoreductase [Spirosoma validum]|uniref:GMC family oxidoreductase n=1 Tax=Spirosoma validum TaxID=2771355 RepID=A0A927B6E5_9BACT|nr:GMC family oxidoreductase [Spirosoma validum]MBD2756061.1 GMC family oxidoreductase [Spirosoma validum]
MAYLSIDSVKTRTYDAIVIGSGISGGWAAKELTQRGLRTLLLERGRPVDHITDYPTATLNPWELEHRGQVPLHIRKDYSIASRNYAFHEDTLHFFAKDSEQPYVQEKPYDWIHGYQVGGRSLTWGRQTQRWSDFDFEGPARDGFAVDWPIRYADIAPWYSHVEKFVGITGNRDGLATLPDGEFLPPHEMSCVESYFKKQIATQYNDRHVIIGRAAHLTQPKPIHYQQGRAQCQHRTLCERGCPYGGYFSSNASTIPWALRTGKLTLQPNSVVHSIIYDDQTNGKVTGKATGVRVIDTQTHQMTEYYAHIIFVNASALHTNLILLNSISTRFPNGLGNDSGLLGTHVAFHSYRGRVSATYEGFSEFTTDGRRPNSSYIPRFRNVVKQETDFLRGYAATFYSSRPSTQNEAGIGSALKHNLLNPGLGEWQVGSAMMAETIPKPHSTVRLDPTLTDNFGIPQLRVSVGYDENDEKILRDFFDQFSEMYTKAGFKNIRTQDTGRLPGSENHEMGGVRMGRDPKTSLLNRWNQLHHCPNVFVTDGACMTSTSTQNPSLTYMALTARAANYAVKQMKALRL